MTDIILSTQNGEPVASSRQIAESFGKEHRNVMRDIENLMMAGVLKNEQTRMFYKTEYTHEQNGQTYPMYLMNRDGFTLLAMRKHRPTSTTMCAARCTASATTMCRTGSG